MHLPFPFSKGGSRPSDVLPANVSNMHIHTSPVPSLRWTKASILQSFLSSDLFFCKLIIFSLFCSACPDGKASCSHNAVVIPPAHGALSLVNTLPIVSRFAPPAPVVRRTPGPAEPPRLRTVRVSLPDILSAAQGKPSVVIM